MTPLLLMFGIAPAVAVGTDLLYAAITKCGAVWVHQGNRTVEWRIAGRLALGSIPGTLLAMWWLKDLIVDEAGLERIIVVTLSVSLILTATVLLLKERLHGLRARSGVRWLSELQGELQGYATVAAGALIGLLVTLSSVDAGALGAAILLLLYPTLPAVRVVGTDLAHAVLLAAAAGIGHLQFGTVDFGLLGSLLVGSLPGIYLGTRVGVALPERVMRPVLGGVLLVIGVGFLMSG
jgi:uncharacterized membrane protein YfcA